MAKGSGTSALVAFEKRICAEIEGAPRKRAPTEAKIAAVARTLAPHSNAIRGQLSLCLRELVKQDAFDRELYGAGMRALAETSDKRLITLLTTALKTEDFGGLGALSAACFVQDPSLTPMLARAAACQKTQLAFAAEVARLVRGENTGARLFALAPRIKEAHRISLCVELLLPICLHLDVVPERACVGLADALHVLRGSERHLGRWLVMAEIAHKGGDKRPMQEATERMVTGPDSSRAAWTLVAWALDPNRGTGSTRPTSELVARLSHRPSADRDTAFLFRMAEARVDVARPMLEALARTRPLGDDVAVRAAFTLAKHFERLPLTSEVLEAAESSERDELRALAAAAYWDLGDRERALALCGALAESSDITAQGWSALVHIAAQPSIKSAEPTNGAARNGHSVVLTEPAFRRVQWGWIE
ncbi:MAG: hypothetical protein U0271_42725 [Polyangiaceae bacterium]